MRFFSLAGGVNLVPVALQIVPAGNVDPLLDVELLELLELVLLLEVELVLLLDVELVDAELLELVLLLELVPLLEVELLELDVELLPEVEVLELLPVLPLLEVELLPEVEVLELLAVLGLLSLPPDPLEVGAFVPQATRDCATSGAATKHTVMAEEGSFMSTFFPYEKASNGRAP
jgi:hypothetical protein